MFVGFAADVRKLCSEWGKGLWRACKYLAAGGENMFYNINSIFTKESIVLQRYYKSKAKTIL